MKLALILSSAVLGSASMSSAQTGPAVGPNGAILPSGARPEVLNRVFACREITSAEARLACFDAAVGAMDVAQRQGDVVVVDRVQVREARRQLFGFQMPNVTLFDQGERPEAVEEIETTLVRASQAGDRRWTFILGDESVWQQTDSERVSFRNRPDQEVRVRRAALGSYLLTIGSSRAVRVRRQ